MVGPRIGRFDIDGKPIEFKHHSIAFIATGTLILWVGFYGFNGGSVYISNDLQVSTARLNLTLNSFAKS